MAALYSALPSAEEPCGVSGRGEVQLPFEDLTVTVSRPTIRFAQRSAYVTQVCAACPAGAVFTTDEASKNWELPATTCTDRPGYVIYTQYRHASWEVPKAPSLAPDLWKSGNVMRGCCTAGFRGASQEPKKSIWQQTLTHRARQMLAACGHSWAPCQNPSCAPARLQPGKPQLHVIIKEQGFLPTWALYPHSRHSPALQ